MRTMLRTHAATLAVGLSFVFAACGDVGEAPEARTGEAVAVSAAAGEALPIDTARSEIKWKAAKVTRAHDGGFRMYDGTVSVAGDEVKAVNLQIDTRSIWTDTERLTGHLKSADFFDVEQYPSASFVADQIVPTDSAGATHLVTGNLTMHGQTNSVTFPATITMEGGTVHAVADFIIDRTRWGIVYTGQADDLIENNVRLILDVYAGGNQPIASGSAAAGADSTQ